MPHLRKIYQQLSQVIAPTYLSAHTPTQIIAHLRDAYVQTPTSKRLRLIGLF